MERWWNTWESALYNLWFWGTVPLDLIILTLRQEHKILEGDIIRTTLNWKPYRHTQAACQGYRQSDLLLLFPFVGSRKTLSQASKRSRPQGLLETLYVRWWVFTWVLCSNKQKFELVVSGITQWMSFVRDKIKTDNDMHFIIRSPPVVVEPGNEPFYRIPDLYLFVSIWCHSIWFMTCVKYLTQHPWLL